MGMPLKIRYLLIPVILIMILILVAGCAGPLDFAFPCIFLPSVDQSFSDIPGPVNPTYPPAVADVINEVRPAVVTIDAEIATCDTSGRPITEQLTGSGWIYDQGGFIVTNSHVVEGAKSAVITLADGQTYTAESIWADPLDDLAVIDIGAADLKGIAMGDSSKTEAGDQVIALGNASGEGIRATQGIIISTDSTFTNTRETLYDMLETSTPIAHGNSGGPLINMSGQVIGITTAATLTRTGTEIVSYAISSSTAAPIIQQLIQNGCVSRAWLGVNVCSISELSKMECGLSVDKGVFVLEVKPDSPAWKGGLKSGDVIIKFNNKDITSTEDLVKAVQSSKIGQLVSIVYWHDKNENTDIITLSQVPLH
jgi:serine protease Do